jgi:hypothetical protein
MIGKDRDATDGLMIGEINSSPFGNGDGGL